MSAVKTSPAPLDPSAFAARFSTAARAAGFREERFGARDGCPLVAYTRRAPGRHPRIYLSAGIHGDEPAGPLALLELLTTGAFDHRATWFLVPLLNPTGFTLRTRENAEAIDLNRDYRHPRTTEIVAHVAWLRRQPPFDLTLCLHEDWEATGYYLYELAAPGQASLAPAFLTAAAAHLPIDPAAVIDGRPVTIPGLIHPQDDPLLRETWPEAISLRAHHTPACYTLETPSTAPLATRVSTHVAAVTTALDAFQLRRA